MYLEIRKCLTFLYFNTITGSDVLSGSLQGLVVCLLIVFGVSDIFKNRWDKKRQSLPVTTRYELNTNHASE